MLPADEVAFDADVYLLTKVKAKALKTKPPLIVPPEERGEGKPEPFKLEPIPPGGSPTGKKTVHITGAIPLEVWNKLGTKLLPRLKSGTSLRLGLDFSLDLDADAAAALLVELRQVLSDLNLTQQVRIEVRANE